MNYPFLDLDSVSAVLNAPCFAHPGFTLPADASAFLQRYRELRGNQDKLSKLEQVRRDQALRRLRPSPEDLWDDGNPTRAHIVLIAWAYSPSPKRLYDWLDWLDEQRG